MAFHKKTVCGVGIVLMVLLVSLSSVSALRHNYEMTLAIEPETGQFCAGDIVTFTATDAKSGATLDDVTVKLYVDDAKVATLETGNDGNASHRLLSSGTYELDAFRRNYMDVDSTFRVENCTLFDNESSSVDTLPPKNRINSSIGDSRVNASNTPVIPSEPGVVVDAATTPTTSSTLTTSLTTSIAFTTMTTMQPPPSSTLPPASTLAPSSPMVAQTTFSEEESLFDIEEPRMPVLVFLILIFCIGVLLFLYFGILQSRREERKSKLGGSIQDLPSNLAKKAKSTLKKK